MTQHMDLASVLDRLGTILRDEVQSLADKDYSALPQCMDRKARCLLEISRTLRPLTPDGAESLKVEIERVRELLYTNERALAIHLEATTRLGAIVREVLVDQSSDGTYADMRMARR